VSLTTGGRINRRPCLPLLRTGKRQRPHASTWCRSRQVQTATRNADTTGLDHTATATAPSLILSFTHPLPSFRSCLLIFVQHRYSIHVLLLLLLPLPAPLSASTTPSSPLSSAPELICCCCRYFRRHGCYSYCYCYSCFSRRHSRLVRLLSLLLSPSVIVVSTDCRPPSSARNLYCCCDRS
jgi:hypothetical protein